MNLQFSKMNERMMKEGNPLIQCCNSNSSTKQMLNNDENYCSKKKRNGSKFSAVVPKIGGILSSACGMSRNVKERIILAGDDDDDEEEVRVGRRGGRGRRKGFHIKKWKKDLVRSGSGYHKSGIAGGKKMEEEEGGEGVELCKKRILMGEKCRPLNLSGALHYDEDGIILVEFHR